MKRGTTIHLRGKDARAFMQAVEKSVGSGEEKLQESCNFPHCAIVERLEALALKNARVAEAADVLIHTIHDRKSFAEFERDVEVLRNTLCAAGYGGNEVPHV